MVFNGQSFNLHFDTLVYAYNMSIHTIQHVTYYLNITKIPM